MFLLALHNNLLFQTVNELLISDFIVSFFLFLFLFCLSLCFIYFFAISQFLLYSTLRYFAISLISDIFYYYFLFLLFTFFLLFYGHNKMASNRRNGMVDSKWCQYDSKKLTWRKLFKHWVLVKQFKNNENIIEI